MQSFFTLALALAAPFTALATAVPSTTSPEDNTSLLAARSGDHDLLDLLDVRSLHDDTFASLDVILGAVEDIPDDVLAAGDAATNAWLDAHGYSATNSSAPSSTDPSDDDDDTPLDARSTPTSSSGELAALQAEIDARDLGLLEARGILDVLKCAARIAQLLLEIRVPAAKLLRIKQLIKALGGAKKAAEKLLKAKNAKHAAKIGGSALKELFTIFSGYSNVKKACKL